jgi:hypothetical protein
MVFVAKRAKTYDIIRTNRDFIELRKNFSPEFDLQFRLAYQLYIDGDWQESVKTLKEKCLPLKKMDGPSHTLLKHMEEYKCKATEDWNGYRELTEK